MAITPDRLFLAGDGVRHRTASSSEHSLTMSPVRLLTRADVIILSQLGGEASLSQVHPTALACRGVHEEMTDFDAFHTMECFVS